MPSRAAGSRVAPLAARPTRGMHGCGALTLVVLLAGCAGSGDTVRSAPPLYLEMTDDDIRLADATVQDTLEHVASASSREWRNVRSGHSGSVTPTSTYVSQAGLYCREFTETLTIGERRERYRQEACRDVDGQWKPVR